MPRGSKPGERRGGRQPGTPNKKTQDLLEICHEMGFDPFKALVQYALTAPRVEMRFDATKEIAHYVYPKRKAVELSTDEEKGFRIILEDYACKK